MTDDTANLSASSLRADAPLVPWETALERFVTGVRLVYGPRVQRVLLYGSRARGDAQPDSDIDVMVVLDACTDFWAEHRRLGSIAYEASVGAETIVSAIPIGRDQFEERQSPLLLNVRREGTDILSPEANVETDNQR